MHTGEAALHNGENAHCSGENAHWRKIDTEENEHWRTGALTCIITASKSVESVDV